MNESVPATVVLTRCDDYTTAKLPAAMDRHIALLGGLERFIRRGDRVLLKPNFIAPKPADRAVQTHPAVILELARRVLDLGGRPVVGDSPAWGSVSGCAEVLGLTEPLRKLGIPLQELNHPKKLYLEKSGAWIGISKYALEADKIINLPKFKTHQQLTATFAVKNMFGCVSGKAKPVWHYKKGGSDYKFCKLLIGIYQKLQPVLTIIDAVEAMDGPGPINGRTRKLGWLIGGTDPMACEAVCCELIGMKPEDLPMLRTARRLGFGIADLDQIEIRGDDYKDHVCTDFQFAQLIPIRFSLYRIIKSKTKQILILLSRKVRLT